MVKALTSDVVAYQIPDYLRAAHPNLKKFLQYYYQWAEQESSGTGVLNRLIQNKDIDTASEYYADRTVGMFLHLFPETSHINKTILVKNIREFFTAKGSLPTFEFLMRAIFNEDVTLSWQSEFVLRPSDNKYVHDVTIAVEVGTGDFTKILGAKIEQTLPWYASGYAISYEIANIGGRDVCIILLDHKKVINTFEVGSTVRFLHRDVLLQDATENDYATGTVLPLLGTSSVVWGGSGYIPGDRVNLINGNGVRALAVIEEVNAGTIDEVMIENGGYGYAVGDTVSATNSQSEFSGVVSTVDGTGAEVSVRLEVNDVYAMHNGYAYAVGDILEATNLGVRDLSVLPLRIQVTAVDSTWELLNIKINNPGIGYRYFSPVIYNPTGDSIVAGLSATSIFNDLADKNAVIGYTQSMVSNGSILDVKLDAVPSISANNLQFKVNGFGATATATIITNSISSVTVNTNGWNYVDPIIEVVGDGVGAILRPTVDSNGRITAITVAAGGSGYTTASIIIKERSGSDFSADLLINDQTLSKGQVVSFNIISRGVYERDVSAYNIPFVNLTGSGHGFVADVDYRLYDASIHEVGHNYSDVSFDLSSGRGRGAEFRVHLDAGSVDRIEVVDGGSGYSSGATVVYDTSAGVNAVLTTNVVAGVIKSVDIVSGGSGYTLQTFGLLQETGDSLLIDVDDSLLYDSLTDNLFISHGSPGSLSVTLSDSSVISGIKVVDGGSGLWDTSEVPPLKLNVNSITGYGVLLHPIIESGVIIKVKVLHAGTNYSEGDTITVTGSGSGAVLVPEVFDGKIIRVYINNGGVNYQYGTQTYLRGDGKGAQYNLNINTGIEGVIIHSGGTHVSVPTLTVTDPTGSGASLRAVLTDGTISNVIVETSGAFYSNPTIVVGSGSGTSLQALVERKIHSVDVTNHGSNYTVAGIDVLGDFTSKPKLEVVTERRYRSLRDLLVVNRGSGYTSIPTIKVSDFSAAGRISTIDIEKNDEFKAAPILSVSSISGSGAEVYATSTTIGSVSKVTFREVGIDYTEIPLPVFYSNISYTNDSTFIPGESVTINSLVHLTEEDLTSELILESGVPFELEDDSSLDLLFDDYRALPSYGTINSYDTEVNKIRVVPVGNYYELTTENSDTLITESGMAIDNEMSIKINVGDVVEGVNSFATAAVNKVDIAVANISLSGMATNNFRFDNNFSMLSNRTIKLHDNNMIQDFAYVIDSSLSMGDYDYVVTNSVHPAGYKMFGRMQNTTFIQTNQSNLVEGIDEGINIVVQPGANDSIQVVPFMTYRWVEPIRFSLIDTPMNVFSDISINELSIASGDPLLDERLLIGRQEAEITITP